MSVTRIRDANAEPDEDVVAALEEALDFARRGELRTVAIAGDCVGNRTFSSFSTHDTQGLIGLLSFLPHTLCARQRENVE